MKSTVRRKKNPIFKSFSSQISVQLLACCLWSQEVTFHLSTRQEIPTDYNPEQKNLQKFKRLKVTHCFGPHSHRTSTAPPTNGAGSWCSRLARASNFRSLLPSGGFHPKQAEDEKQSEGGDGEDGKRKTKVMQSRRRPVASALRFSSVTSDVMSRHCRTST